MKIKINKRISLILSGIVLSLSSCTNNTDTVSIEPYVFEISDEQEIEEESKTVIVEQSIEEESEELIEEIDTDSIEYNTNLTDIVIANKDTNIVDNNGKKLGTFIEGRDLLLLSSEEEYYLVDYYGKNAYIKKEDADISQKQIVKTDIISKGYLPNDALLYESKELDNSIAELSKLEFLEIYKELENCYLVQTIDYIGYIPKDDVTLLDGNMAVVDRSNQELRLYEGNEMTICTPVVTGTRNTGRESDLGLFKIHTQAEKLYIVPGAWVDCVDYYNRGEGIHTAGWRKDEEFGGNTYIKDGSHGCINTPHDEALYIHSVLKKGDKVLVKE